MRHVGKTLRNEGRHAGRSTDQESVEQQQARENALEHMCEYTVNALIRGLQVERMTMLREEYCSYVRQHFSDFYNPDYKTYKLKEKIAKRFGHRMNDE